MRATEFTKIIKESHDKQVSVTTVKGRTYTGTLSRMDDRVIVLKVDGTTGTAHGMKDQPASNVVVIKRDFVKSMTPVVNEGEVVQHKFGMKQAQKGKTPYYKNPDIEVPMFDPKRGTAYFANHPHSGKPVPFDYFELQPSRSGTAASIIGITKDGKRVQCSSAPMQLADVLVNAYNRGGFTDMPLQKVPMSPSQSEPETTTSKKPHLSVVKEGPAGLPGAAPGIKVMSPEQFVGAEEEVDEATKLPAQARDLTGQELQDYLTRVVGTTVIDPKTGKPKINKITGQDKYTSGKTKRDKYRMPYVHRSSALSYYSEEGKKFDEQKIINELQKRPAKLLKQNEKMQHSNGEQEQFFNIGFAALTGIAVDENTNKLIIVNTCPGAGSCQVDCFAMKGNAVQFKSGWISRGRILTYLLNDPQGFKSQLHSEIQKEVKAGQKGGYAVTIRWHDSGDFFSPEYLKLAFEIANENPEVKFYAYTKMAAAAMAAKPKNFIINWSEGAHAKQEKQIKAQDPSLEKTKNSRIVPTKMFSDLLVKSETGKMIMGPQGQWQIQPDKINELKQRLAKAYGISPNSILTYAEYERKPKVGGLKYNVIIAPGEGDTSANDPSVLSTLLLQH
jgi:small nuclear ribonucleoprotein (snRNP)-like protein